MLHNATSWQRYSLGMGAKAFQHLRSLFSFVNDTKQDREVFITKCRETLRELGKHDDHVTLHLPFSPPPAGVNDIHIVHSGRLPSGLETLKKTAVIEIYNPSARNALSGKMMAELADIVAVLEVLEVCNKLNTVVIKGTGGWFCAGADLRVVEQELGSSDAGAVMGALMVDTLTRFRRLPLVSVAYIEGGAFGGGAELAIACDFRIIDSDAVIQFVQARMGVVPGWGGGARLYKVVGRQNALRLLCTAEKLSPERGLKIGLVDEIFSARGKESSYESVVCFLADFEEIAPAVSHGTKRVINNADEVSLDSVLAYEHDVFKTLWGGPANLEALQTALTKKK